MTMLRGVNLGGWLVLERWMTPSLFAGTNAVDEYTFLKTPGAEKKLRRHHKTFIREEDFRWLSRNGVNAVRIPVGYWILDGDTPFVGAIERLDWAFKMAAKYRLRVLLCLHGAPGSQNGHDHSGRIGPMGWFDAPEHQQATIECLRRLTERYRDEPEFWGIELLNEPQAKFWQPVLRKFYTAAYDMIRATGRPGLVTVFSDAFTPRLLSGALWAFRDFPVVMDHHWYHFFIPKWLQPRLSFAWYYRYLRYKAVVLRRLGRAQPIIIGEWNGIIGGEKLGGYPENEHPAIVGEHIRRQIQLFEASTAGWFYWSYKTDDRGIFHFRSLVEDGVIVLGDTNSTT